jgi:hypothetical protein
MPKSNWKAKSSRVNLEDKLAEIWEQVNRDALQSVFFEWMARLEQVTEYEGDYSIN